MCIKREDKDTHHPHHNLEWDIPPGVVPLVGGEDLVSSGSLIVQGFPLPAYMTLEKASE